MSDAADVVFRWACEPCILVSLRSLQSFRMNLFSRWQGLILPVGVVVSVLVILAPLPAGLLDILLAANITAAVVVLLTTIYVKSPLEFSVFPSLLLATTLSRLVLNVASTRLILTRAGDEGLFAAGGVIKSFGEFVAGDRIIVGLVVFAIIVVIQLVVITKGATRISEVAARFALDGMPGRQAAVDGERAAGVIDDPEAQRRRREIEQQADFYGAMDGASKFVRGDAIAGVVITAVNIVGGLAIGVFEFDMGIGAAVELFTKLTIGDGLVSQVPSLLISLAAGLLVTRSAQQADLPQEFVRQLISRPQALAISGGFLVVLMLTSLPKLPLLTLAGACVGLAFLVKRQQDEQATCEASERQQSHAKKRDDPPIEDFLAVDPMEIEIGVALIRLADPQRGGDLLSRITGVRHIVAAEMGIVLPKVRIRDNLRLDERSYRLKIANVSVASGTIQPDRLLAVRTAWTRGELAGEPAEDPASRRPALWIDPAEHAVAESRGWLLVEPAGVLAGHLREVVCRHAAELLTRDATQRLIEELKKTSPAVVDELIPQPMKLADVQHVLQLLLDERVSIRQLATILETLGDHAGSGLHANQLAERVRQRLARSLCSAAADENGELHAVTLSPQLETRIAAATEIGPEGAAVHLDTPAMEAIVSAIAHAVARWPDSTRSPVLLVRAELRRPLWQLIRTALPYVSVLSDAELTDDVTVQSLAAVPDPFLAGKPVAATAGTR